MNVFKCLFLSSVISISGMATVNAQDITGAGATFVFPAISKWSADYAQTTNKRVNYQSIGSGGGIAQIKAGTVDFGSSDKPLTPQELSLARLGQFPSVIGGVVPVTNIPGIGPGQFKITGALLADIYLAKITKWNDPKLVELNPGLSLPDLTIRVIYRSDGSGTTFNYTNYLSKVNAEWKTKVGENTAVKWPIGIGGKGNEGVSAYVKQLKGSIGYVELSYALQNKLSYASMQNAAGNWVQPSAETFQAAASSANWATSKDFFLIITNAPGENAWPIAATNFILIAQKPKSVENARAALDFFRWAYASGDEQVAQLGYVPLPDALVTQVQTYWKEKFKF